MSEKTKLLERLCESFRKIRVEATSLGFHSPEAIGGKITYLFTAYDPYEGIQHLGSIKIMGRDIDQMQVFTRIIPGDITGFKWYDIHFLVREDPKGKEKTLTVNCKASKGFPDFLTGKTERVLWRGGSLAEQLNKDKELRKLLVKVKNPYRIRPDKQYGCVRVIVQMSREESKDPKLTVSKTMEHFSACERIAWYVRNTIKGSAD